MHDILADIMPKDVFDPTYEPMAKFVGPSWFGILKEHVGVMAEPESLPSLRVTLRGTRQVVLASMSDMLTFMVKMDIQKEYITPSRAWSFMLSMNKETVEKFKVQFGLHCITVCPGKALYMPLGWMAAEKMGAEDIHGVCFRGLVKVDDWAATALKTVKGFSKDWLCEVHVHRCEQSELIVRHTAIVTYVVHVHRQHT